MLENYSVLPGLLLWLKRIHCLIISDGGCSQMINNCVKSTDTPAENECLATLLIAEQTSGVHQQSASKKIFSLEEKVNISIVKLFINQE